MDAIIRQAQSMMQALSNEAIVLKANEQSLIEDWDERLTHDLKTSLSK